MELKKFRINYSILCNGEEYPNSAVMEGVDSSDARQNLESLIKGNSDVQYKIFEVTAL